MVREVRVSVDEVCSYFEIEAFGVVLFVVDECEVFFVVPDDGAFVYVGEGVRDVVDVVVCGGHSFRGYDSRVFSVF